MIAIVVVMDVILIKNWIRGRGLKHNICTFSFEFLFFLFFQLKPHVGY